MCSTSTDLIIQVKEGFARRPPAFDVPCNLHSQIHEYNLHPRLKKKNVDSNVSDDSDVTRVSQRQILRQPADLFNLILSSLCVSQWLVLMLCLTAWL